MSPPPPSPVTSPVPDAGTGHRSPATGRRPPVFTACLLLLFVSRPTWAEPEPPARRVAAELRGRVLVKGLQVAVPGIEVKIRGPNRSWRIATDADGRFRLGGLPPGRYQIDLDSPDRGAHAVVMLGAGGAEIDLTMGGEVIEMTGRPRTDAEQMRESSEAVQVVTTETARRESADLGDVLARGEGLVGVQRSGGLGSDERLSIDGFRDDQVRLFVDGIPLEATGLGRLANVPVNLVEQIEVYRGVVPVRFGADALGGAINLVTGEEHAGNQGLASYQVGSFGTHRLTLSARAEHAPSGAYARASGFYDTSDNDYEVDVEVADDVGRLDRARVRRFHDGYRAAGASLELGRVSASGSEQVSLRGYMHEFDKELQHNLVMTVPYGDARQGGRTTGAMARYRRALMPELALSAVLAYAYRRAEFEDLGTCIYDWFGECVSERPPGEIGGTPDDLTLSDHHALARIHLDWSVRDGHALRLSLAPSVLSRTGENHLAGPGERDPLAAERHVYGGVGGLEYQLGDGEDALENTLFVKVYAQRLAGEEELAGGMMSRAERTTTRVGAGDGIRYRFVDWLWAKASYEFATRLPDPREVFGDGARLRANLDLAPETSHNVNLGIAADLRGTAAGTFYAEAGSFGRFARNFIRDLENATTSAYENVYAVRALGVQASGRWRAPGERVSLQLAGTWQDVRNASPRGEFGEFDGDRIPNEPYLFGNARSSVHADDLVRGVDALSLSWTTRYVHAFYRAWESLGREESKQKVASQVVHGAALNVAWEWDERLLSFTLEAQNLTDARAFDVYGVERPGRALFAKMVASFR